MIKDMCFLLVVQRVKSGLVRVCIPLSHNQGGSIHQFGIWLCCDLKLGYSYYYIRHHLHQMWIYWLCHPYMQDLWIWIQIRLGSATMAVSNF